MYQLGTRITAAPAGTSIADALNAAQEKMKISAAVESAEFNSAGFLMRRSGLKAKLQANGRRLTQAEVASALDAAQFGTTDRLTITRVLDRLNLMAD